MKTYRELLQTDTYWITKIQNDLYNAVEDYLAEHNMTRTEFAKKMGVSKGYISQVLNGDFNHRLSKLVELSLAIGKAPMLDFEDLNNVVEKESKGMVRRKARYVPRKPFGIRIKHGTMEKSKLMNPGKKQNLSNASTEDGSGSWESGHSSVYSLQSAEFKYKETA